PRNVTVSATTKVCAAATARKTPGHSSSSDTPEAPLRMTPDFEEFDGVDDILAVR
ncbi:hypothetical protein CEXT_280921, partial [Caerostris extrusa]